MYNIYNTHPITSRLNTISGPFSSAMLTPASTPGARARLSSTPDVTVRCGSKAGRLSGAKCGGSVVRISEASACATGEPAGGRSQMDTAWCGRGSAGAASEGAG